MSYWQLSLINTYYHLHKLLGWWSSGTRTISFSLTSSPTLGLDPDMWKSLNPRRCSGKTNAVSLGIKRNNSVFSSPKFDYCFNRLLFLWSGTAIQSLNLLKNYRIPLIIIVSASSSNLNSPASIDFWPSLFFTDPGVESLKSNSFL